MNKIWLVTFFSSLQFASVPLCPPLTIYCFLSLTRLWLAPSPFVHFWFYGPFFWLRCFSFAVVVVVCLMVRFHTINVVSVWAIQHTFFAYWSKTNSPNSIHVFGPTEYLCHNTDDGSKLSTHCKLHCTYGHILSNRSASWCPMAMRLHQWSVNVWQMYIPYVHEHRFGSVTVTVSHTAHETSLRQCDMMIVCILCIALYRCFPQRRMHQRRRWQWTSFNHALAVNTHTQTHTIHAAYAGMCRQQSTPQCTLFTVPNKNRSDLSAYSVMQCACRIEIVHSVKYTQQYIYFYYYSMLDWHFCLPAFALVRLNELQWHLLRFRLTWMIGRCAEIGKPLILSITLYHWWYDKLYCMTRGIKQENQGIHERELLIVVIQLAIDRTTTYLSAYIYIYIYSSSWACNHRMREWTVAGMSDMFSLSLSVCVALLLLHLEPDDVRISHAA